MTKLYPLMPLRDIVIFPHMVAPLVVGRKQSIQALEDAMEKKTDILLVTQKEPGVDEPSHNDLHAVGTLATIMHRSTRVTRTGGIIMTFVNQAKPIR